MNWKSQLSQIEQHTGLNSIAESTATPAHVDIILTVYNGYDALQRCVQSLLAHTNRKYPILIYNDASTDSRVKPYLDEIEQQHEHIKVTHHDKNMGYLANVNHAMANSSHDVVLLNSDTQVTTHWLTEMLAIATHKRIGTVCPLSNDATILSLKNHQQHEQLQSLKGLWFEIPTAVGFCMLIKRKIIKQLGVFDDYYAPGYGEECDYSMRIRLAGYHIAAAPAAFVYHQGSQSFDKAAKQLKQQHQKLLELRWPNYNQEIHDFSQRSPVPHIDRFIEKTKGKTKVLHVVHGLENKGGVELFTLQLLQKMQRDCHHDVLTNPFKKAQNKTTVQAQLGPDINLIELPNTRPQGFIYTHRSDLFNDTLDFNFSHLLLFGQYDVVHFHSLVGIGSMLWPLICQLHNVPYALYFHDHFGLCQIYSMLTNESGEDRFCGRNHMSATAQLCQQCIEQKTKYNTIPKSEYMQQRIQIWEAIMSASVKNYYSSHYLMKQYQQRYPGTVTKNQVLPPCFLPTKISPRHIKSKSITIAFLGHFTAFKGAHLFLEAQRKFNHQPSLNWKIIGGVEQSFQAIIKQQNISCTGAFKSVDLPKLLADVDLIVLCSLFPESYSITLSESLYAGIPVIAAKIGAFADRVNKHNGLLFEAGNSDDLATQIKYFIQHHHDSEFMPTITFENTAQRSDLIQLEAFYTSVSSATTRPFAATINNQLDAPQNNAYQQMTQWLNAPHTLEAEPDWRLPDAELQVCVIGHHLPHIEQSQQSVQQLLPAARYIDIKKINNTKTQSNPILVLLAGTVFNDNIGNWLAAFKQADRALGLADFSLINEHEQLYAPHFQQQFSWINHRANNQAVGALLIDPTLTHDDIWITAQNLAHNMQLLQTWLQRTIDLSGESAIHYFPHYSYALLDQLWAENWKQAPATPKPSMKPSLILLVIESQKPARVILSMVQKLRLQNGLFRLKILLFSDTVKTTEIDDLVVYSLTSNNQQHVRIKQHLKSSGAEQMLLLNDNVILNDLWCLNRLLFTLTEFKIDAVSPPAATSRNKHHLIGNKLGGGLFFYSKGVVTDTTFHPSNHPIEHSLLDEDCVLITREAWLSVQDQWRNLNFYQTFRLSQLLRQHNYQTALVNVPGLLKTGLPSVSTNAGVSLESERSDIIDESAQFKPQGHYSTALNSRKSNHLDVNFGTFKTPKNRPRIIAYAHDSWASGFYRVKSPLSALAAAGIASVLFLPENQKQLFPTPYEVYKMQADCLLLHHAFSDLQLAHLQQFKQQLKLPIIVSLDDLLTEIPDYNPITGKIPKDILSKLKTAFKLADQVIVSTDYLATQYRALSNNITVIPNYISEQVWPIHSHKHSPRHHLRIGWSGAGQHQADLAWLAPVVKATKDLVQWVFFGDKPAQVHPDWIEYHPPVPFAEYHQVLPSLNLDIGIAPLLDNPFNHAKSHLKLLEYGALGLAVICSDLTPYQSSPAIRLNNNTDEWITCIKRLNQSHNEVKSLGKNMSEWVIHNHILERNLDGWKTALGL
jgi:glycosyltransferase involved in cell wall biosynthesis